MRRLSPRLEIFAVGVGLLLMLAGLSQLLFAQQQLNRAAAVIANADRLSNTLINLETGYRGYVIGGTNDYLEPYHDSQSELRQRLLAFATAEQDHRPGSLRSEEIWRLAGLLQEEARQVVDLRGTAGFDEARNRLIAGRGKVLMDGLRAELDAATREAEDTQVKRNWARASPALIGLGGGLTLIALSLPPLFIRLRNHRIQSEKTSQLFTDVMAKAPLGVAIVSPARKIIYSNSAFADLVASDQPPMRLEDADSAFVDAVTAALSAALSGFRASFKSQPAVPVELSQDGATVHLQATLFPVETAGGDGKILHAAALLVSDVTRQRSWETELEAARDAADAANRAKSSFLANMSHELRTPLTAVLGYCELLEEEIVDAGAEALLSDLGKISMNARHLLSLINDVLDLSKIEAEKLDVVPADVQLGEVLEAITVAADGLMLAGDNRFVLNHLPSPDVIRTDELRLRQILLNLLSNAAKFTRGGTVTLSVRAVDEARAVLFEVVDTGIGMNEEQLAGLFTRFQQADQTTTRRYGGTGLGLALTKALVTMLGGHISVESQPDAGTTVRVRLPVEGPEAGAGESPDLAVEATPAPGAGQRILVVDDDPGAREHLYRVLTREGFSVATCTRAEDAVEQAIAFQPSAILLDVIMPGMDGWQVLQRLRGDARTADIPVIMQTLLDAEHVALALGADGYLHKPLSRVSLLRALSRVQPEDAPAVMIVDDDRAARERLARVLRKDGWSVTECADGSAALAALAETRVDVVLVDLVMPIMDGHTFVRTVRAREEWAKLPIIVLTAESISSVETSALSPMAADIIQKGSISLAALAERLRPYGTAAQESDQSETEGSA